MHTSGYSVNTVLDLVGFSWMDAQDLLESDNLKYNSIITRPPRNTTNFDRTTLYVIRQHFDADGVYQLVLGKKMGKEVCQ